MIQQITQYKKKISERFIKYAITGIVSLGADYGSFLAGYYILHISLKISVLIGLFLGFIVNFCMNKFWSFRTAKNRSHHPAVVQLVLYSILFTINYAFTYFFIRLLQHHNIPASFDKLLATGCITIWNYFVYKLAIFKQNVDVDVILE